MVGLLASAVPAAAEPLHADLQLAETPHCALPPGLPACPVGHDPGATGAVGDDTVYVLTVVEEAFVQANLPGALPVQVAVHHESTTLDNPVFRIVRPALIDLNNTLPAEVKRFFRVEFDDDPDAVAAASFGIYPYVLVPIHDPDRSYGVPLIFYFEDIYDEHHIYPLLDGGARNPLDSDEQVGHVTWAVKVICLPETRPLADPVCQLQVAAADLAYATWTAHTPTLSDNAGLQAASVGLGDPSADLVPTSTEAPGAAAPPDIPAVLPGGPPISSRLEAPRGRVPMLPPPAAWMPPAPPVSPDPVPEVRSLAAQAESPRDDLGPLAAAASLGLLVAAWLFHRITRARALDHAHRATLLDLVRASPGLLVGEAAKALGVSFKCASYHARVLARGGHLQVVEAGRHLALYPEGVVHASHRPSHATARLGPHAELLRLIRDHPALTLSEYAALSGGGRSGTHAKLARLRRAGLVAGDASKRYTLLPKGQEVLAHLPAPPTAPPGA